MRKQLTAITASCAFALALGLAACGGGASSSATGSQPGGESSGAAATETSSVASGTSETSGGETDEAKAAGYLDQFGSLTAKALVELDGAALTKVVEGAGYTWTDDHAEWTKIGLEVAPSRGLGKEEDEAGGYSILDTSKYDFTSEEVASFAVGAKGTPVKWLISSKGNYADVADVLASQQVNIVDQCEVDHRNYGKQIWAIIENGAGDRFLLCASHYSKTGVVYVFNADYLATNARGVASSFNLGDYLLEDAHTIEAAFDVIKSGEVS